ncbi:MAG: hypothetical protein ABIC82_02250 [bacterium]
MNIKLRKIKKSDLRYFLKWWKDKHLIKLTSGLEKWGLDKHLKNLDI